MIVEFVFSEDGNIEAQRAILAVGAIQIAAIAAGLYFIIRRPNVSSKDLDPDLIIIYHGTNDVEARLVPPDT